MSIHVFPPKRHLSPRFTTSTSPPSSSPTATVTDPSSYSPTLSPSQCTATNPVIRILDFHLQQLDLTLSPPPSPLKTPPRTSNSLITLATTATSLSHHTHTQHILFAEVEQQLQEALRDADAMEAVNHRFCQQHTRLSAALRSSQEAQQALSEKNNAACREISMLQECIATLQQAHNLDAQINAAIISDQAEEIKELRNKLATSAHFNPHPPQTQSPLNTNFVIAEPIDLPEHHDDDESSDGEYLPLTASFIQIPHPDQSPQFPHKCPQSVYLRAAARTMSARDHILRKRLDDLQRKKNSLFDQYQRRHSASIHAIVRNTSQRHFSPSAAVPNRPTSLLDITNTCTNFADAS